MDQQRILQIFPNGHVDEQFILDLDDLKEELELKGNQCVVVRGYSEDNDIPANKLYVFHSVDGIFELIAETYIC